MLLTLYFLFIVYLETTYILWQLTKIKTENAPIILSKQKYDERIWWPEKRSCHCGTFLCCKVFIRTSYLTFQQSCLFKSVYFTSALLKSVCEHFKYIVSWKWQHTWRTLMVYCPPLLLCEMFANTQLRPLCLHD